MNGTLEPGSRSVDAHFFGVLRVAGDFRLVSLCRRSAGERLFELVGDIVPKPSQHSVQIDDDLHLDLDPVPPLEQTLDRFFWRFMNHSCDPNSRLQGRELFALRDIEAWEAITFDYNTTEWHIAHPFVCRCGAAHCLGEIRGYRHLSAEQRRRIEAHAAAHVRRLAAQSTPRLPTPRGA